MTKGDKKIVCEVTWRYATFLIESDTLPVYDDEKELYEQFGDSLEFLEAGDGDVYYHYENMTEEEIAEAQAIIDEDGIYALEDDWTFSDTMWYFDCPVEIEEVKE
jgi:hypothetical protein